MFQIEIPLDQERQAKMKKARLRLGDEQFALWLNVLAWYRLSNNSEMWIKHECRGRFLAPRLTQWFARIKLLSEPSQCKLLSLLNIIIGV